MVHKILEDGTLRFSYREGEIKGEHIFENHFHARYEMIAVIEGKVSIIIENSKYSLTCGMIAIIPPLKYHSVFVPGNTQYKRVTVLFDEAFIPEQISADFISKTEISPVASNDSLLGIFSKLKDVFYEEGNEKFIPLASSLIMEAIYIHTFKETVPLPEFSHPLIKSITNYVNEHITQKILLDDIAAHLFVSKSTVCHLFSSEMKISLKQYILQKKISHAAKLIEEGVSASEASLRIGYDNYANFYKMYFKIMGTAPKKRTE